MQRVYQGNLVLNHDEGFNHEATTADLTTNYSATSKNTRITIFHVVFQSCTGIWKYLMKPISDPGWYTQYLGCVSRLFTKF